MLTWADAGDALLWSCAALLLGELFGVLPVAVVARQLRVYVSLWRSSGTGGKSDEGADTPASLSSFSFWSRVWLSDIDLWRHLNNCRYYQRCEEGRFHFLFRSGLGALMHEKKYTAGLAGCLLRFRRELRPLQSFRVQTRLIGWDARSFFIEHKFFSAEGFVHAHGVSTYKLVKAVCAMGVSPAQILRELYYKDKIRDGSTDKGASLFPDERLTEKGLNGLKVVDNWSSLVLGAKKTN